MEFRTAHSHTESPTTVPHWWTTPETLSQNVKSTFNNKSQTSCRSLLLYNSHQVFIGGADKKVRYWNFGKTPPTNNNNSNTTSIQKTAPTTAPTSEKQGNTSASSNIPIGIQQQQNTMIKSEKNSTLAAIVTPPHYDSINNESFSYSSNFMGDVNIVQETCVRETPLISSSIVGGGEAGSTSSTSKMVDDLMMRPGPLEANPNHKDSILDLSVLQLQYNILVTAGRDGLVKLWR